MEDAAPETATPPPAGGGGGGGDGGAWGFVNAQDGAFTRENWADGLPADLKDAAPSVAPFKNLGELIRGHYNLKQRLGKAATATFVPDFTKATPEELSGYRKAINAPETAADYKLDEAPNGIPKERWSPEMGKQVSELLHKHHASHELVKDLMKFEAQRMQAADEAAQRDEAAYRQEIEGKLKAEFKGEYEARMKAAKAAAQGLGVDLTQLDEVSLVKAFARLHTVMTEDERVRKSLGQDLGSLTAIGDNPASRATDIMTNPQNPLYTRYHGNDAEIRGMVQGLLKQAAGG